MDADHVFYSVLGERIRIARKEKGIDQESFARSIGLTRASMVNIEKGRQRPSIYQIWMMARILNIQLTELIPPVDLYTQIDIWKEKVSNHIKDEGQQKYILEFISVTRNNK